MIRFIGRRLLFLCFVLLGISVITFALTHLVPGDPARLMAGQHATGEQVKELAQRYGLDKPVATQFWIYMKGLMTGDLGMRDGKGIFHHLGRTDNQIKVKGNRIELEEVEAHLRQASGTDIVAVVGWSTIDGSAQGLVGFCNSALPAETIATSMLRTLPRYMVPNTIHVLDVLPVNINGKVDRRALVARLRESEENGDRKQEPSSRTAEPAGAS